MENLGRASPSRTETYQYAVPVTIESISKGFVAHKFLIYRHFIPQMRMFYRALYIIENPHSPNRRVKRRLPSEIINIITKYVKAAAVEQGFLDSERQIRTSVYVELEEGLRRLERWAASTRRLEARPPEDMVYLSSQRSTETIGSWHLVFKVHEGPILAFYHAGNVGW
jgi:hypothetical protein